MSVLLAIHSFPGAMNTLLMPEIWAGFKSTGWDILGVETVEGNHFWPEPVPTIKVGSNVFWMHNKLNLPMRFLGTIYHFLNHTPNDHLCIVEYDTYICGKFYEPCDGLTTHLAGGQLPDSKSTRFFHTPWIMDRETAKKILKQGTILIMEGEHAHGCHGSPDVFLGLIVDRLELPFNESNTFSVNTIEAYAAPAANEAYKNGCKFFHGVKRPEHITNITG